MGAETERAYLPHIWIHPTGFGPKVWAGEIMFRGDPVKEYIPGAFQASVRVRFAPLTKAGFDELTEQLQADINRVLGAA